MLRFAWSLAKPLLGIMMSIIIQLLAVLIYFLLITAVGMAFVKFVRLLPNDFFLGSFLSGSIIIGVTMLILAQIQQINLRTMVWFGASICVISSLQIKPLFRSIKSFFGIIFNYVYHDRRYSALFSVSVLIILLWYVVLAAAPPRSGDAMRYHLAQLKDIVVNHGFVFRPYYHYNFPMYFSMLFLPVYFFFGNSVMNIAHTVYFFFSVVLTLRLAAHVNVKYPKFLVCLFLLMPISYFEAHKAGNDWVLLSYVLVGVVFLASEKPTLPCRPCYIFFSFLSLGFALGVKYHATLFILWFVLLSWNRLETIRNKDKFVLIGLALIAAGFVAAPWYLKNIINTGNPTWPLLLSTFSMEDNYLYSVIHNHTRYLSGDYSADTLIDSVKHFAFNPTIPASVWILTLGGLWLNRKTQLLVKPGIVLFFCTWWLLQPKLLPRFSTYILPFAYITIGLLFETLQTRNLHIVRHLASALVTITLAYGIGVAPFLCRDHIRYLYDGDLDRYHKTTRFYREYKWMNSNLPEDAKLLIIVSAGQTYYCDRSYLRADPWSSGVIDWSRVKTPGELIDQLDNLNITHIFYEKRDWRHCPGGANMMTVLENLQKADDTMTVWERDVKIYYSRLRSLYSISSVILLKI